MSSRTHQHRAPTAPPLPSGPAMLRVGASDSDGMLPSTTRAADGSRPSAAPATDDDHGSADPDVRPVVATAPPHRSDGRPPSDADLARRLGWFFHDAPVAIVRIDLEGSPAGRVLEANPAAAALVGHAPEDLLGLELIELFDPDRPAVAIGVVDLLRTATGVEGRRFDLRCRRGDGSWRWTRFHASPVLGPDGRPTQAVGFLTDITDDVRQRDELAYRALHDPLTGAANRNLLDENLGHELRDLPRRGGSLVLIYVDLDGFKQVNDRYGHAEGDRILRDVARRLAVSVRGGDTVARIGGDEFAVLCPAVMDEFEAIRLGDRIVTAIRRPFDLLDTLEVALTASVGIALTNTTTTVAELVRAADDAMYRAKTGGRDRYMLASDPGPAAPA